MSLIQTKSLFKSKTIWGGVIALVGSAAPVVLPLIGVQPSELVSIVGAGGAILAIAGRIAAKHSVR